MPPPPPAAAVPFNAWDRIEVPELGAWTPSRTVSIVLPAFQCQEALDITFAGLAHQTYPAPLLQAVIVDDGSQPPLRRPVHCGDVDVVLVRQEDRGFGSGRCRNAGAEIAEGEILMLLDADMLPAPWQVEAHARWHHAARDVVTLGERRHIVPEGLTPHAVAKAARQGTPEAMRRLLAGRKEWDVRWIEQFLGRTERLRTRRPDLFRIFTGGNAAMSRSTWDAVGGMSVFGVRGTEDTELGYRLANHGAVFVPDVETMNWHQGASFFQSEAKARAKYERTPVLANHIPIGGFRPATSPRTFAVPLVTVVVEASRATGEEVVAAVDAVLGSQLHDLAVCIRAGDDYPERKYLRDAYEREGRVTVEEDGERPLYELAGRAPYFAVLPERALAGPATIGAVIERLTERKLGALHLTIPGVPPGEGLAHAFATGPSRRSARVADDRGADWQSVLGELFGEQWAPGGDLGLTAREPAEAAAPAPTVRADPA